MLKIWLPTRKMIVREKGRVSDRGWRVVWSKYVQGGDAGQRRKMQSKTVSAASSSLWRDIKQARFISTLLLLSQWTVGKPCFSRKLYDIQSCRWRTKTSSALYSVKLALAYIGWATNSSTDRADTNTLGDFFTPRGRVRTLCWSQTLLMRQRKERPGWPSLVLCSAIPVSGHERRPDRSQCAGTGTDPH